MKKYAVCLPLLCSMLLTACAGESFPISEAPEAASTVMTLENAAIAGETEPVSESTEAPTEEPTEPTTEPSTEPMYMIGRETVEVYEKLTAADFVTDTNAELTDPEMGIPTDQTGDFTVTIPCRFGSEEQTVTLSYRVADTTPPVIINNGIYAGVKTGQAFKLNDLVGYADNYDRAPTLTYTGTVNTGTPGTYPITATVTDASGNATTWDLNVTVASTLPKAPAKPKESFSDFTARYAEDGVRFGIDVSKWQAKIDWNAVHDAGVSFAIIRCGYGDTGMSRDEYYYTNIRNAAAAGVEVGVYFHSTASNVETARKQADWVAGEIAAAGTGVQLPVAFDWESWSTFQKFGMNLHDMNAVYAAFEARLAEHGYSTMLYSSLDPIHYVWDTEGRTIWLARYNDTPEYSGYTFWQQANTGQVPGINGDVDLDMMIQ